MHQKIKDLRSGSISIAVDHQSNNRNSLFRFSIFCFQNPTVVARFSVAVICAIQVCSIGNKFFMRDSVRVSFLFLVEFDYFLEEDNDIDKAALLSHL